MEKQLKAKNTRLWLQRGMLALCIFILAFVFSLRCTTNIWNVGVPWTDSSVFQYVARVMLNGGMPYRDTFDHKGPLLFLINAAGLLISKWRGVWLMELATLFATFAAIYKIGRLKCSRIAALFVVFTCAVPLFLYFDAGNYTEEYALPFIGVAIYIFADYFLHDKINRRRLILCGMAFCAVCLLKLNMVVAWGVMCLTVLIQCLCRKQFKQLGFFLEYFILGILIFALPICIWLAANGAFTAFIEEYFLFNFQYTAGLEEMNINKRLEVFVHFLKDGFVPLALIFSVYLAGKKRDAFHLANVVLILVTLMASSLSGKVFPHYGMILVPTFAYPFACIAAMLWDEMRNEKGAALLVLAMFLTNSVLPIWIPAFQDVVWMSRKPRETYLYSIEAQVRDIIDSYCDEDDDIIVFGNWDAIYNLSNRFAASKYSYQDPIGLVDPAIMEALYADVKKNRPKVAVIQDSCYFKAEGIEFLKENSYQQVFKSGDGGAEVYVVQEVLAEQKGGE